MTCCRSDSYQTEPRMKVLGHGIAGFFCCSTSGSLAKHSHPKRVSATSSERSQRPWHLKLKTAFEKDLETLEVCCPCESCYQKIPKSQLDVSKNYGCLPPASNPSRQPTEECNALPPCILGSHTHALWSGLVWPAQKSTADNFM